MARKSSKLSPYSNMLLNFVLYSIFYEFAFAFPSYPESRQSESLEKPTSTPNNQQVRYLTLLSCVSHFSFISLHTYLLSTICCFTGSKSAFRSYRVCCDRYCCCSSSCCIHHTELLLSAEVYATCALLDSQPNLTILSPHLLYEKKNIWNNLYKS